MSTETDVPMTQRCADGEHDECAGFSGGPRWRCACDCHPDCTPEQYALLIARQAMKRAQAISDINFRPDELARQLVRDLREGGVLR